MAHVRPSRRHGKPDDVAETTTKYGRPNGEGDWTVHRAHDEHLKMHISARPPDLRGKRTREQLIAEQAWKLRSLRCELRLEDNPERRARLAKSIEIKRVFLSALMGEP